MSEQVVPNDVTSPIGKLICQHLHYTGPDTVDGITRTLEIPTSEAVSTLSVLTEREIVVDQCDYYVLSEDVQNEDFGHGN